MVAKWCYKRRLQLVFSHSLPVHLTFHALALPFLGATDKEGAAVCRGDNYKKHTPPQPDIHLWFSGKELTFYHVSLRFKEDRLENGKGRAPPPQLITVRSTCTCAPQIRTCERHEAGQDRSVWTVQLET